MNDSTKSYTYIASKNSQSEICQPKPFSCVVSEQSCKNFNVFNKDFYPVRKTTITKIKYVQK